VANGKAESLDLMIRLLRESVAQDLPYDKAVDVYSFGVLLWQICTLEKPFADYSREKHMREVIKGGERPKMDITRTAYWPVDLQSIIKSSWSTDPEARPNLNTVIDNLDMSSWN